MESHSAIEWSRAFETVGGDKQLLCELMKVFIEEQASLVAAVQNAIATKNGKELRLRAHSIKGALNHLGAIHCGKLAASLEKMGNDDLFLETENVFEEFIQALQPVGSEMNKFIDENNDPT
jgi:HPt (histidine-containing phosphotransfer) domain-containing protein